jgi:hypothetical protein
VRSTPIPLPFIANPRMYPWALEVSSDGPVKSVTAAYTAETTDETILGDATGGAFSVTLPPAASCKGLLLTIKRTNAGGNAVTIDGNSAETIDGAGTVALSAQYAARTIRSDGTNWVVLASI